MSIQWRHQTGQAQQDQVSLPEVQEDHYQISLHLYLQPEPGNQVRLSLTYTKLLGYHVVN